MKTKMFIMLAAVALALPVASAQWFGAGQFEPNTVEDTQGSLMWPDAPGAASGRIYFNAYPAEGALRPIGDPDHAADGGAGTGINPNSGLLGTALFVPGLQGWVALLGVWADCNGDDTIGLAESALMSYPSAALLDKSICPDNTEHNNGVWVHEYIPIGHDHLDPSGSKHPVQIDDREARVWGDIGRPTNAQAQTCPITPIPHGTTSGTGALLRYGDCFAGKRVTRTVNENDQTGLLAFEDENNPQESDSVLNQHFPRSLFGNPTTGEDGLMQLDSDEDGGPKNYAFKAWDCEEGAPAPEATPESLTTGSFADALNHTTMGLVHATNPNSSCEVDRENSGSTTGGNPFATAHVTAFQILDAPHGSATQVAAKDHNDMFFAYFDGENDATGLNTPSGLGTALGQANIEPQWQSFTVFVAAPQSVNRNTLQFSSAAYWTFYATVDSDLFDQGYSRPGGEGKYGSEACGTFDDDLPHQIASGSPWLCSSKLKSEGGVWCPDCLDGWDAYEAPPHTTYYFKDTDCADGTVTAGVRASLTDLAPEQLPNFCGDTANP